MTLSHPTVYLPNLKRFGEAHIRSGCDPVVLRCTRLAADPAPAAGAEAGLGMTYTARSFFTRGGSPMNTSREDARENPRATTRAQSTADSLTATAQSVYCYDLTAPRSLQGTEAFPTGNEPTDLESSPVDIAGVFSPLSKPAAINSFAASPTGSATYCAPRSSPTTPVKRTVPKSPRASARYEGLTDEQVVALATAEDKEPLGELTRRYHGLLMGYMVRKTRERSIAESVVSDMWERVVASHATFDPEKNSVKGWMFAILNNRWKNRMRDDGRDPVRPEAEFDLLEDGSSVLDLGVTKSNPLSDTITAELLDLLDKRFATMNDNQQDAFRKRYTDQITAETMAENEAEITDPKRRDTFTRARRKMIDILREY